MNKNSTKIFNSSNKDFVSECCLQIRISRKWVLQKVTHVITEKVKTYPIGLYQWDCTYIQSFRSDLGKVMKDRTEIIMCRNIITKENVPVWNRQNKQNPAHCIPDFVCLCISVCVRLHTLIQLHISARVLLGFHTLSLCSRRRST